MKEKIKIVCFGGGTGLPTLLTGLKNIPWFDITAVVTAFDSGGSSGQLRDTFGILPPSDILRCVLALAPDHQQKFLRKIFLRRIAQNHTGGNALVLGLGKLFEMQQAIDIVCDLFSVHGKVFPVTLQESNLCGVFDDCRVAFKETDIDQGIREGYDIRLLYLYQPVQAHPSVLEAIQEADIICIGPGSFYTSVLPNFLPHGIRECMHTSDAPIIFILNLMTEGLGMQSYTARRFVKILEAYIDRPITVCIANTITPSNLVGYAVERKYPIDYSDMADSSRLVEAPLWFDGTLARHSSEHLGSLVYAIAYQLLYGRLI